MVPNIETERLLINPLCEADYAFIYELLNSKSWLKNIGNRNIENYEDAQKYIQGLLDNPHYFCHVFSDKSNLEKMGIVTFIFRENQEYPDIGYAILPQYEKKGFTYEAAKNYLEEVKNLNRFKKVIAITLSSNIPSIKLLERLNMKFVKSYVENDQHMRLYSISGSKT